MWELVKYLTDEDKAAYLIEGVGMGFFTGVSLGGAFLAVACFTTITFINVFLSNDVYRAQDMLIKYYELYRDKA